MTPSVSTPRFLLLPLLLLALTTTAQKSDTVQKAQVAITVTDMKGAPRKGETVLFIDASGTHTFNGTTNAAGKTAVSLPAGDTYTIKLKTITDAADYSRLEIPALEPGQFYNSPFTLAIQYEPARNYTLNNVHFDTGKPTLRPESFPELDEIAAYLRLKEGQRMEIAGHTDNVGSDADNLRLSQQRAANVKAYLVKKGIAPARLDAKGYGASQPVADNSTEEGRRQNRRTEAILL